MSSWTISNQRSANMKYIKTAMVAALAAGTLLVSAGNANAAGHVDLLALVNVLSGNAAGQPNASCEDTPNPPGNSSSAPGSAFNPDGTAGAHYAGEQTQNSKNPHSGSQYDVACTRP